MPSALTRPDYLASLLNDESAALRRAGQMVQEDAARLQAKFAAQDEARGWPKSKAILFNGRFSDAEPGEYWSAK